MQYVKSYKSYHDDKLISESFKYEDEQGKSFEVKSIFVMYTDRNRFYKTKLYDDAEATNLRKTLRSEDETNKILKSLGVKGIGIDEKIIKKQLLKKGITFDIDDSFDPS